MAVIIISAMIILVPLLVIYAPKADPYHHGAFQSGTIYVVDSVTGDDVSSYVDHFEVYVTNNTSDLDAYWSVGNSMDIDGIYSVLSSISPGLSYTDVVLYTIGIAPYTESTDTLASGETYVWLPKA